MKKAIITVLLALIALAGQAQIKVTGHVINERGEGVEYVCISFEEDDSEDQSSSVGVISDAQGHFTLTIPTGRKDELTFTHVFLSDSDNTLHDIRRWARTDRDTERQGCRTGRGRGRSERQAAHTVGQVVDKDKHGRFSW